MFTKRKVSLLVAFLLLGILIVACQPQQVEVTRVVEQEVTRVVVEEVVEEGEVVEVTRVVTEVVEVPAEGEEAGPAEFVAPRPDTYTFLSFGDVDTLDPALMYDNVSSGVVNNVYEPLIYFNDTDATSFVPWLATEVPSVENGGISEDGLTYTFNIREGVTFHEGGTLEPHDVEYTFERGLLQSDVGGPQWLYIEPMMGYVSGDITEEIAEGAYAGDPEGLKTNASPEELLAVCEKAKASVESDDAAGTVTFNLAQPWSPFLATLAAYGGRIVDSEWVIEQGDWDGSCETWADFYSPGSENSTLTSIANGTGPYMLDHWTPGEEWVMVANENYWRPEGEPPWEGGPSGVAKIKTVIYRVVNEWGTRFAALQAGDAETVQVNDDVKPQVMPLVGEICDWQTRECTPTENPNGPLRLWEPLPGTSRTDVFLNFNAVTDEQGNNPYIGSGQLDGNGIPPDFFSDINVRRAMNNCFDYDLYLAEAYNGNGVRNNGPIIQGMLGYNPDGEMYEFDLDQCAAELEQAWGGVLPETGFRFSIAFNTGNTLRQTAAEILQANLGSINENYQVEIVGLPWPTYLRAFRAVQLPVAISGWGEDIHDPHNWVQPFTFGTYAGRQNLPEELVAQFQDLASRAVQATDNAVREELYYELQQLHHDQAIQITLIQPDQYQFEHRWVEGYPYFLSADEFYVTFYNMSLKGAE
jgi:peptide/nickel transport system substrate-binding protein